MSLILVVDDESDVEMLFRQQFRRELRAGLFRMDFALSAVSALQRMSDVAAASLILIAFVLIASLSARLLLARSRRKLAR